MYISISFFGGIDEVDRYLHVESYQQFIFSNHEIALMLMDLGI
jgi:hypothetical protein